MSPRPLDTAEVYGPFTKEEVVGEALAPHRFAQTCIVEATEPLASADGVGHSQ